MLLLFVISMEINWVYTSVITVYLTATLAIALYFGRKETKSFFDFTEGGHVDAGERLHIIYGTRFNDVLRSRIYFLSGLED